MSGRDAVNTHMNDAAGLWIGQVISSVPATYTVFYDNVDGVYRAVHNTRSGTDYENALASTVINGAIGSLSFGRSNAEKIVLKGPFTVDAKISVPAYTILDLSEAKLSAKVSLDDNMIEATGYYYAIYGGVLDGNKVNNASGHVIRCLAGSQRFFIGNGMRIINAKQNGIHLEGTAVPTWCGVGTISHVDVEDCGSNGLYSGPFSADHLFFGINAGGNGAKGILLSSSDSNNVEGCLCWNNTSSGIDLTTSSGNRVSGNRCDWNGEHGISLSVTSIENLVEGNTCYDNGIVAANTYSGIYLSASNYNLVHDNKSHNIAVAAYQKYGIAEASTSDYNRYNGNYCNGTTANATAPYYFLGANNIYEGMLQSEQVQINGATTIPIMTFNTKAHIARAKLQYSTAVANDTNVTVGFARDGAATANYYVTSVSSGTGNIWKTLPLTLAHNAVTAGDTITFTQDGSGGAGEYIRLILEYCTGA